MILDQQNLLSDKQAITASAASTNVIDMQVAGKTYLGQQLKRNAGKEPIPFFVSVNQAFNTLTSLTISIQTALTGDEAFASPTTVSSVSIPLASLKVGSKFPFPILPSEMLNARYLRVLYSVVGTNPTLGQVSAGVVGAVDQGYYGNV